MLFGKFVPDYVWEDLRGGECPQIPLEAMHAYVRYYHLATILSPLQLKILYETQVVTNRHVNQQYIDAYRTQDWKVHKNGENGQRNESH